MTRVCVGTSREIRLANSAGANHGIKAAQDPEDMMGPGPDGPGGHYGDDHDEDDHYGHDHGMEPPELPDCRSNEVNWAVDPGTVEG